MVNIKSKLEYNINFCSGVSLYYLFKVSIPFLSLLNDTLLTLQKVKGLLIILLNFNTIWLGGSTL